MKVSVIINSSAGPQDSSDLPSRIISLFKKKNVDAQTFECNGAEISELVKSAVDSGSDIIAAAGGDGTISAVVNHVIKTSIPLGVIPLGTLNHFAKDNGIPVSVEDAVDIISRNKIMPVDAAEVNGHFFINNSSVGFYPKIVKHRDKEMKAFGYGKWYAMFRAIFYVFGRFPVLNFNLDTDHGTDEIKTPFIFIGNNRYSTDLFNLGKREKMDEGILSLYYPKVSGKWSMIRFAFLALINRLHQEDDFVTSVSRGITINSRRDHLEVSTDGEVLHLSPPLEYRIYPGKLKLLVP